MRQLNEFGEGAMSLYADGLVELASIPTADGHFMQVNPYQIQVEVNELWRHRRDSNPRLRRERAGIIVAKADETRPELRHNGSCVGKVWESVSGNNDGNW
jgi:hypothetical protein